jgi:LysM repeat protein
MDQQTRSQRANPDEIFAEAAQRIQAGEPLELVVASYPESYQRALRDLLSIVATATELHGTSVPAISLERRTARKAAFLQAAALYSAERAALTRLSPAHSPPPSPTRRTMRWPAFRTWLDGLWMVPSLRPMAAALATVLVLVLSSSLITLAESAVPGDLSYPLKQWIRNQQLYLAPEDDWATLRQAQERELVEDVQKAQLKADSNQIAITVDSVLLFHGYGAGYWDIGDLFVIPEYKTDPNQSTPTPIKVIGDLVPGATVHLRYQIIPGQQAALGARVVQGVELVVISTQPLQPTPLPTETLLPPPTPTVADAPTLPPCQVTMRPGWAPYTVRIGDNLSDIAQRTGVSSEELRTVNCLNGDYLVGGKNILVPGRPGEPIIEPPSPGATTPIDALTPEATPDLGTVEPSSPTEAATITSGENGSATPDVTLTPGTLPELSPTAAITIPTSVAPTTQSPAATSIVSATATVEPVPGGTDEAPLTPLTGTPDAPGELETPPAATEVATPTPLPTDESGELATPTEDATQAEPTEAPLPTSPAEGGEPPTPTPTAIPGDPSTPPTAEAPTPAPSPPDSGGGSGAPPDEPTSAPPPDQGGSAPGQEPAQPPQQEPPAPPPEDSPAPPPQDPPTPVPPREDPPPRRDDPPAPPPTDAPPPGDSSDG